MKNENVEKYLVSHVSRNSLTSTRPNFPSLIDEGKKEGLLAVKTLSIFSDTKAATLCLMHNYVKRNPVQNCINELS